MTIRNEKPLVILGEWARTGSKSAPWAKASSAASRPVACRAHGARRGGRYGGGALNPFGSD
jgi:hypothetical protein